MKWIKTPHPTYILTKNENSYPHGYGIRSNSPPPYTPYVPPVYPYSYYKIAADGSYALVKGTTTGNPDEIKNQKIKDIYNKKKALQLAKIAGIIDAYLDGYNDYKSKKSLAMVEKILSEKNPYFTAGGGPDKDPLLIKILKEYGDDKLDEAGTAINVLSRAAGEHYSIADALFVEGNIPLALSHVAKGSAYLIMAVSVMLRFPL
jgi:hypothetical protein